jgi:Cu2+-exporting ATPase
VRKLQALDSLAGIDTLVFDKTGTITRDVFVVGTVSVRKGVQVSEVLAMAAALALHSLHPVSRALLGAARLHSENVPTWVCASATEFAGQGISGNISQGSDTVARPVMLLRLGSAAFCGVPKVSSHNLLAYLSDDAGWLATFELEEDIRPDAVDAITALKEAGVVVHMLSGDSQNSVERVAAQAGISFARGGQSPTDKLEFLRELQSQGQTVAMVGDGLNDGPVLAGAHVAFAFGKSVPLAQSKADFVVMGDKLMRVVSTLNLARRTRAVVHQNLWWALLYNAACVPLAVMGYLPAWAAGLGMAASSIFVVLNALRLTHSTAVTKEI